MHEHMHYHDNACMERLKRVQTDTRENKAGFRSLYYAKGRKYCAAISFQGKHYTLRYYPTFDAAVKVPLEAEETLQVGYREAFQRYEDRAKNNFAWGQENPFLLHSIKK